MKISLTPADIIVAIKAHLVNAGVVIQDKTVTFNFSNKRSKGGIFAEVTIFEEMPSPVIATVVDALTQDVVETAVQQDLPLPEPVQEAPVDVPEVPTPAPMINLFG